MSTAAAPTTDESPARISVSFKSEDTGPNEEPIGPVIVIDHAVYDKDPEIVRRRETGGFGIPFGYEPQGRTDLGWKSRREALAIAASHGVQLIDY